MRDLSTTCSNIRLNILELSNKAKSAHAGSALSCVEILGSIFWMKYHEKYPISKFVLSKGHAAMALYATASEFELIDKSLLNRYLGDDTAFWGHPSVSEKFSFIHWSTGSLGHGLPACVGFAYAEKFLKKNKEPEQTVIAVLSDGELNEGSNWEAILFASHHKLNNLVIIVDYNKIQSFGRCSEVADLDPLNLKFESFCFNVHRVDGHNPNEIIEAIKNSQKQNKFPTCIIADTTKGKGVASIENTLESHYKPISNEQIEIYKNEK